MLFKNIKLYHSGETTFETMSLFFDIYLKGRVTKSVCTTESERKKQEEGGEEERHLPSAVSLPA